MTGKNTGKYNGGGISTARHVEGIYPWGFLHYRRVLLDHELRILHAQMISTPFHHDMLQLVNPDYRVVTYTSNTKDDKNTPIMKRLLKGEK